jgi:hypothetical protein
MNPLGTLAPTRRVDETIEARRPIGAALLHPLSLVSLAVLVVNDHYLKQHHSGALSGKLSDFAAVLLLPLVLAALSNLVASRVLGRLPSAQVRNGHLVAATVLAMLVLALPEVSPLAERAYRHGFGVLLWPFRAALSLVLEGRVHGIRPVGATADVTDLIALPMGLVALALGWERTQRRGKMPFRRAI